MGFRLLYVFVLVAATVVSVMLIMVAGNTFWSYRSDPMRSRETWNAIEPLMLPFVLCAMVGQFVISCEEKRSEASSAVPATEQYGGIQ